MVASLAHVLLRTILIELEKQKKENHCLETEY